MTRLTAALLAAALLALPAGLAGAGALPEPVCVPLSLIVEGGVEGFAPRCTTIASGDTVRFFNKDVGPFSEHNPASADAPTHQCFMAVRDTGSPHQTFEFYDVTFAWDGTTLTATTEGGTTVCSTQQPTTYTVVDGAAHIPYVCTYHEEMTGTIVVEAA